MKKNKVEIHVTQFCRHCGLATLIFAFAMNCYAKEEAEIEGYMGVGAAFSNSEAKYMERIDEKGNYDETHFGIALHRKINERWSATGEIAGSGEEHYDASVETAFITFRAYEEATFNLGKMPYPNLLVSEIESEGVEYPWVRPPEELYRAEVLGPALNYSGFAGLKANYLKKAGRFQFLFSAYGGGSSDGRDAMSNMSGAVISVGDHRFKVRAGYNHSTLSLGTDTEREAVMDNRKQTVNSAAVSFNTKYIIGMAEYADAEIDRVDEANTSAFYYTIGLRTGRFLLHFTEAEFEAENKHGQNSVTWGLKYRASSFSSIKLEYKTIKPHERVDSDPAHNPAGHFAEVPKEKEVSLFSLAVDVKF